jgi:hypothetical protein
MQNRVLHPNGIHGAIMEVLVTSGSYVVPQTGCYCKDKPITPTGLLPSQVRTKIQSQFTYSASTIAVGLSNLATSNFSPVARDQYGYYYIGNWLTSSI